MVKSSSQLPVPTNSNGRREHASPHALRPSSSDGLDELHRVPAVASLQSVGPVASATEDDKPKGSDLRSDETDAREPALGVEQRRHNKHGKKKRHTKKKSAKTKKKERADTVRSTQDNAALLTSEQHEPSAASPNCNSDPGSSHRGVAAATPAVSTSANPEPECSADEVTHPDDGTINICIRTSMRTRSGLVWPFRSSYDS
ncbi:hypothetical protein HPB52_016558 [Rhipicephalus sanguineus]|uniref:Uncharacterized protein n=1 Tax=Rhipicephalus sanguineus TaxID=34632 RepID=A0A9D4TAT6_RHISA|nr:hypothetical protein HPB52_016558 [Rhipicephalus sanguineus]